MDTLIAVGIAALLIAGGAVTYIGIEHSSDNTSARQELDTIATAEQIYITSGGGYATSSYGDCTQLHSDPTTQYTPGTSNRGVYIVTSSDSQDWTAVVESETGTYYGATGDNTHPTTVAGPPSGATECTAASLAGGS